MKRIDILNILIDAKKMYKHQYEKDLPLGMCGCIYCAMLNSSDSSIGYKSASEVIPEFNHDLAVEKFGAGKDSDMYWWPIYHGAPRLDYFDYLIDLYSK